MGKARYYTLLALGLLLFSCDKPESGAVQGYLIFGEYYGMCQGPECIRYYKIQDNQLHEDTADMYPSSETPPSLAFSLYGGNYPTGVMQLPSLLPGGLYSEGNVIGMPDAYDQGGYYLELNNGFTTRYWKIDRDRATIPVYLHEYCDTLDYFLGLL